MCWGIYSESSQHKLGYPGSFLGEEMAEEKN